MDTREQPEKVSLFNADRIKVILCNLTTISANIPSEEGSNPDEWTKEKDKINTPGEASMIRQPWNTSGRFCSTCEISFDSMELQRQHFKMDWHKFNIKQKLMEKPTVSLETFEEILSGDVSSISGSESDSDSDLDPFSERLPVSSALDKTQGDESENQMERVHPKSFFSNSHGQIISLYRAVINSSKNIPANDEDVVNTVLDLPNNSHWGIFMSAAGHFAGAIFKGKTVLVHKTFHRYTVRAKRGTAQGLRDGQQGGAQPKSAGSNLRRYNEAALLQEVQNILETWTDQINSCGRIFIRAASYNKMYFFGGRKPAFSKGDARIRTIPFATRRPTFKEVKRVHAQLSTVEVYDEDSVTMDVLFGSNNKKKQVKHSDVVENNEILQELQTESVKEVMISEENETQHMDSDDMCSENQILEVTTEPKVYIDKEKNLHGNTKGKLEKSKRKQKVLPSVWYEMYACCKSGDTEKLKGLLKYYPICSEDVTYLGDKDNICNKNDQYEIDEYGLETTFPVEQSEPTAFCRLENNVDSHLNNVSCRQQNVDPRYEMSDDNPNNYKQTSSYSDLCLNSKYSDYKEVQDPPNEESPPEGKEDGKYEDQGDRTKQPSLTELLNLICDESGEGLLHAAARSQKNLVSLLMSQGADPTYKDINGQLPYLLAGNKEIRNEFRRFMAENPQKYDYEKAKIPSPLTEEMEKERNQKEANKKKAQKKAKKLKQKALQEEKKEREKMENEKQAFKALSDREKRAVAAEKRLAAQHSNQGASGENHRCAFCQASLYRRISFERLDFKYCSTECVKEHKKVL